MINMLSKRRRVSKFLQYIFIFSYYYLKPVSMFASVKVHCRSAKCQE